jgi:hypothetical protein
MAPPVPHLSASGLGLPLSRLQRTRARPATSAPGLGAPCHVCTGGWRVVGIPLHQLRPCLDHRALFFPSAQVILAKVAAPANATKMSAALAAAATTGDGASKKKEEKVELAPEVAKAVEVPPPPHTHTPTHPHPHTHPTPPAHTHAPPAPHQLPLRSSPVTAAVVCIERFPFRIESTVVWALNMVCHRRAAWIHFSPNSA